MMKPELWALLKKVPTADELLAYASSENSFPDPDEDGKFDYLETERGLVNPLPKNVTGRLAEHPEGADRGGYVPWLCIDEKPTIYYDDALGWINP